ncbi:MAG: DUF4910 domain-containing protein [Syntrophales bacterium]|jgi:aminopeptidase-like protein
MKRYEDQIDMMQLLEAIVPLKRTLASNDTDKALKTIADYLPGSIIEGFPCGSKAWTWVIPKRWELDRAVIRAGSKKLVDASWHPLHVMNYSKPFQGTVNRDELLKHLYTNPDRPDAIPFKYSYYKNDWGFCVPHSWLDMFIYERYEIEIDSRFEEGEMNTLSFFLKGECAETFILCSDICHPMQANDPLSGVAVTVDIMNRLRSMKRRKYSYLLLVVPETIGSIAYLANHQDIIPKTVGGFFCEMLGTNGPLVGQYTRKGSSYWDKIMDLVLDESGLIHKTVPFMKSASNDEKVLDSPGVDIPTLSLTRMPYPEYHTSDDNINLINIDRLREARNVVQEIIDISEKDYIPVLNQPGPIFLSGYDLYPDWENNPSLLSIMETFLAVMYGIDGMHSVVELSKNYQVPLSEVFYWTEAFYNKGLLTKKDFKLERN